MAPYQAPGVRARRTVRSHVGHVGIVNEQLRVGAEGGGGDQDEVGLVKSDGRGHRASLRNWSRSLPYWRADSCRRRWKRLSLRLAATRSRMASRTISETGR